MSESKDTAEQEVDIVLYSVEEGVAWITMNRPQYNNAQNGRMTYELDDAFKRAV
ncbi:MAG: enoyl-CoA hydratase, partial [Actinobacteria bacterium]|nr:enoyl-CoA hydratase [Actinomycetota bacterium]